MNIMNEKSLFQSKATTAHIVTLCFVLFCFFSRHPLTTVTQQSHLLSSPLVPSAHPGRRKRSKLDLLAELCVFHVGCQFDAQLDSLSPFVL